PAALDPRADPLPARPLLFLGLLQIVLGCSAVALNFGALSLSSTPRLRNTCPFWAGFSVILAGILAIMTWKRPVTLLANLFVLISIICVLLNLAVFVLGCQGIQFVSSVSRCDLVDKDQDKICFCCEEFHTKCTAEEAVLKLYHMRLCSTAQLILKKIIFGLCVLNAITTTVCLVAAALCYLRVFATRRPCRDESHIEDQGDVSDPDVFVPPAPPPSYFEIFYSCTPQRSRRMLGSDVIPFPHIYGSRIKGIEVFCPLDPPPPYEAVQSRNSSEQRSDDFSFTFTIPDHSGEEIPEPASRVSLSSSNANQVPAGGVFWTASNPLQKRSKSDPEMHCRLRQGTALSWEAATQTEVKAQVCDITLQKSLRRRVLRGRPQSLVDCESYTDTKQLASWILEQSSCNMSPDIHELVENTKSFLKSDEKHTSEAITSATFLEQVVMAPVQQAYILPSRQHHRLLHLESCGDLSTFSPEEDDTAERRIQRAEHEPSHSLIGIVRETVL
ncbi:F1892 protein, partial [Halcyon senegalensis]|nr:F1892 protein [Halcyon senegalensis]